MKYLIKKLAEKQFIQATTVLMVLFLLAAVSINTVIAQDKSDYVSPEYVAKYLTTNASNLHPKINEPVTIKMEYKAPRDLSDAIIFFNYNHKGIQLISGKFIWRGKLKKDQIIKKAIKIKFTEKGVYSYSIGVRRSVTDKGIYDGFTFYVGGAIEEGYQVRDIRGRIKKLKTQIKKLKTQLETERNKKITPDKYQAPITDKAGTNLIFVSPSLIPHSIYLPFGLQSKNSKQKSSNPKDTLSERLYREYQLLNNKRDSLINTIDSIKGKRNRYRIKIKNEEKSKNKSINGSEFNLNNNDLPKTSDQKKITLPVSFSLGQNYPNPFNPTTQISYQIPKDGFVSLVVYNTLGQKIVSLVNQNQVSGKYIVNFNADNLPSGIYIYQIKSGNFSEVKKMILLK